jgi:hypothetical protein
MMMAMMSGTKSVMMMGSNQPITGGDPSFVGHQNHQMPADDKFDCDEMAQRQL